jgi:hypothetical protein
VGILRLAQAGGAFCHGIKHGLEVSGGSADDAEDLGCGGLLLERLFRLVEQSDILDRDDRLIGEGLRQLDLLVREWAYFDSPHPDDANGNTLPQERRGQHRPSGGTGASRAGHRLRELLGQREQILDVYSSPVTHRPSNHCTRARGNGSPNRQIGRVWPVCCDKPKGLTLQPKNCDISRAAEPRSTLGHDVHHGLEVRRRARDDPQDLRRGGLLLERLGQRSLEAFHLARRICV